MFPECADTQALKEAMFDRFEFFIARQRDGMLKTDFENDLVGRQRRIVATQPAAVDAPPSVPNGSVAASMCLASTRSVIYAVRFG